MIWFILAPINLCVSIVGFLLNPIFALFISADGWLPKWLSWFQTFDDTVDIDWFVKTGVLDCLVYDYDKFYVHIPGSKLNGVMIPGTVKILSSDFTLIERLKRYCCRVAWLTRNCAYGFSYSVVGAEVNLDNNYVIASGKGDRGLFWLSYIQDPKRSILTKVWSFYWEHKYTNKFKLRIYIGWKMKDSVSGMSRVQIACHVNPVKAV